MRARSTAATGARPGAGAAAGALARAGAGAAVLEVAVLEVAGLEVAGAGLDVAVLDVAGAAFSPSSASSVPSSPERSAGTWALPGSCAGGAPGTTAVPG